MTADPNGQTDLQWLAENGIELFNRYRGRWIAVHSHQVIADGDTATEVDQKARQLVPDGDFLQEAVLRNVPDLSGFQDNARFFSREGQPDREFQIIETWLRLQARKARVIRGGDPPDFLVDGEPVEVFVIWDPGREPDREYRQELERVRQQLPPRIREATWDLDTAKSDETAWVLDEIRRKIAKYAHHDTSTWTLVVYVNTFYNDKLYWETIQTSLRKDSPSFKAIDAVYSGPEKYIRLFP